MNTQIDIKKLVHSQTVKTDDIFQRWQSKAVYPDDPYSRYIYVDNACNVLGVCHLDTVMPINQKVSLTVGLVNSRLEFTGINTPALDDRLGYYTLVYHLPMMGIKLDWLFCDCEESVMSTASQFTPNKPYNWVVEFDRQGSDCVLYQYDNKRTCKILSPYIPISHGTYSDIVELSSLGVMCVNWGVGSHEQHTPRCYCHFKEYLTQIERFRRFYTDWKDKQIPVKAKPYQYKYKWSGKDVFGTNTNSRTYTYTGDKWDKITPPICDMCGRDMILIDARYYCTICDYGDVNRCEYCKKWYFIRDRVQDTGFCADCVPF